MMYGAPSRARELPSPGPAPTTAHAARSRLTPTRPHAHTPPRSSTRAATSSPSHAPTLRRSDARSPRRQASAPSSRSYPNPTLTLLGKRALEPFLVFELKETFTCGENGALFARGGVDLAAANGASVACMRDLEKAPAPPRPRAPAPARARARAASISPKRRAGSTVRTMHGVFRQRMRAPPRVRPCSSSSAQATVVPYFGFDGLDDYYRHLSLAGGGDLTKARRVAVPLLALNAADDPITDSGSFAPCLCAAALPSARAPGDVSACACMRSACCDGVLPTETAPAPDEPTPHATPPRRSRSQARRAAQPVLSGDAQRRPRRLVRGAAAVPRPVELPEPRRLRVHRRRPRRAGRQWARPKVAHARQMSRAPGTHHLVRPSKWWPGWWRVRPAALAELYVRKKEEGSEHQGP